MAFGDNLNDLHMMQVVGHPVAPENARPEILELAETVDFLKTNQLSAYMEELYWQDIKLIALDRWYFVTTDKKLTRSYQGNFEAAREQRSQ